MFYRMPADFGFHALRRHRCILHGRVIEPESGRTVLDTRGDDGAAAPLEFQTGAACPEPRCCRVAVKECQSRCHGIQSNRVLDQQKRRRPTGMGMVPEGLDMVVRLMTPGEISTVRSTSTYAYDGRSDRPEVLPWALSSSARCLNTELPIARAGASGCSWRMGRVPSPVSAASYGPGGS